MSRTFVPMPLDLLLLRRVTLLLCLIAGVIAASASTASAADDFCDTYEFINNTDEALKLRKFVDGKEVNVALIETGTTLTASDITVAEKWRIRRPSDSARLFTKSAGSCIGAGSTFTFGEAEPNLTLSCVANLAGQDLEIATNLADVPEGLDIAYNLERGDRQGSNFVFLGREAAVGRTSFTTERTLTIAAGTWSVKARLLLLDGTRFDRVDCGSVTVGGDVLAEVDGSQPLGTLDTSCWAVDRVVGGEEVSTLSLQAPGDFVSVNVRSDDGWLGRLADTVDRSASKVIIRGGDRQGTYQCERGWTGDVALLTEETHDRIEIDVLATAPAPNGQMLVLWQQTGRRLAGGGNGGAATSAAYITNMETGVVDQVIFDVLGISAELVDCGQRFVAVTVGSAGGPSLRVVDLVTAQSVAAGTALPGGFDCDGFFYSDDFGMVNTLDLEAIFGGVG